AIAVLLDEFGRLSLPHVLRVLADQGITRLLVESGGTLAAGLLHADLVDRIYWFRAATIIGAEGVPAAQAFGVDGLAAAKALERVGGWRGWGRGGGWKGGVGGWSVRICWRSTADRKTAPWGYLQKHVRGAAL